MKVARSQKGDKIIFQEHPGATNARGWDLASSGEPPKGLRVDFEEIGG